MGFREPELEYGGIVSTTPEQYGYVMPTGTDMIREGDDAISENARVSANLFNERSFFRGLLSGGVHLDSLTESGSFTRQGSFYTSLGYPIDSDNGLVDIIHTQSTPTGYAVQLAITTVSNQDQSIYTRRKNNGTWSAWQSHTWRRPMLPSTHLDSITESGSHTRQGSFFTSLGYPVDGVGIANVIHTQASPTGYATQLTLIEDFNTGEQGVYTRHKNIDWGAWQKVGGGAAGAGYGMAGVEADGEWTSLEDEIALLQQLGQHREAEYFEVGRSVQNRVIPAVRVGFATEEDGSPRPTVLVTAGVHANERGTREAALRLIRELIQTTTVERYKLGIIVIPNVNPDGFAAWTRNNANNVNLNRDFIDATQPETQAVRALVDRENIIGAVDLHGGGAGLRVNFVEPDDTRHTIKPAVMERSHRMFDAVWEWVLDHDEVPWRYPYTDGSDGEGLVGTFHNGIAADFDVPSLLLELPFISMVDRDDRLLPPRVWMAYAGAMFAHGAIDVIYRERQAFQAVARAQSYTIPERHRGQLEQARAASFDSGDIDITSSLTGIESGSVILTRIGQQVWLDFQDVQIADPGGFVQWAAAIPEGYRPGRSRADLQLQGRTSSDIAGPVRVAGTTGELVVYRPSGTIRGLVTWFTRQDPPT